MIRWASVADAEGMARVHVESWEAAYRGLIPNKVIDRLTVERRTVGWNQRLRDPEPRTAAFVAEHGGELVGLCNVGPTRDDDLDAERVGEVQAIYVLPDHWGHGHGRDLMREALDWLRSGGFAAAMLWVLDTNTIGREFYEKGGWRLDDAVKVDESFGSPLNEVRYRIGLLKKS
jgi:GNAT superfamily N-acetyltransferase